MCRIELRKYIAIRIGPSRELDEERREYIVKFLLINVPEVEIEVGQRGFPSIAQGYDILYDRGTKMVVSVGQGAKDEEKQTRIHFSLILLQNRETVSGLRGVKVKSNVRFPCTHKKEPVDFQLLNTLLWKNHWAVPP